MAGGTRLRPTWRVMRESLLWRLLARQKKLVRLTLVLFVVNAVAARCRRG